MWWQKYLTFIGSRKPVSVPQDKIAAWCQKYHSLLASQKPVSETIKKTEEITQTILLLLPPDTSDTDEVIDTTNFEVDEILAKSYDEDGSTLYTETTEEPKSNSTNCPQKLLEFKKNQSLTMVIFTSLCFNL